MLSETAGCFTVEFVPAGMCGIRITPGRVRVLRPGPISMNAISLMAGQHKGFGQHTFISIVLN
jgi:hypothetical protein